MNKPKNQFPLKIILSYLSLGALAVVVSYFLYQEYQSYLLESSEDNETAQMIETGSLINDVYETDSFSRIALLTKKQSDFDTYLKKSDSLYDNIDALKERISSVKQEQQLDQIKLLLQEKKSNIEQLRILKLTSEKDSSLDDILREFRNIDKKIGRIYVEDIITYPDFLSAEERRVWQKWAEYFSETNSRIDTTSVRSMTIDSLVTISRYIIMDAKRENSRTRLALADKENELLQTELNISDRLREIITDFDAEVTRNNQIEIQQRNASQERAKNILKISGIIGVLVMLAFSYIIITDFFKAEKFKRHLQQEKLYSENLLRSREQLMATVSHDLKTPLNTIVGYSELFTHTQLTDKQKNYTQQISSSAHFISKMADDLLDFSKLEAGKLPIEKIPFSLENLLHQIAKASKDLHIQKSIDLHLYIDDELKNKVFESDPLRIQQIINNLVSNAYKFTEEGRIQITANLLEAKANIKMVELAVTDSGIGISKEKQQLIFQEFTQAEEDTFQKFGGSGLGLAISKKIAYLLGGTLEVESTPGEGSTFFLTIPLQNSAVTKLASVPIQQHTTIEGSITGVIIDDDPSMIALLKELFEQMDITAYGYTKFNDFKNNGSVKFDFLLTDIEMPNHTGFDVLKALQAGEVSQFKKQPVIAMTGAKKYPKRAYLEKGFEDMLQKPFSKNQLVAALSPLFINKIDADFHRQEIFENPSTDIYDLSLLYSFLPNKDSINDILAVFYEQTKEDMEQISTGIAEMNCKVVGDTSHRMLTMSRQLNAKRVSPILETMEHCANNNTTHEEMDGLFANLKVEMKKLIEGLKEHGKATS